MKRFFIFSSVFILPIISGSFIFKDILKNKFLTKENNIDNTRFGLQNYGMKWGSKTDEIVK